MKVTHCSASLCPTACVAVAALFFWLTVDTYGVVLPGEVDLTWINHATNATSYEILRKTGSAGTYNTLAVLPPNAFSYVDKDGIMPHTDYEYHTQLCR